VIQSQREHPLLGGGAPVGAVRLAPDLARLLDTR